MCKSSDRGERAYKLQMQLFVRLEGNLDWLKPNFPPSKPDDLAYLYEFCEDKWKIVEINKYLLQEVTHL